MALCTTLAYDLIISLRGKDWVHITSLALPLVIEVPVSSQESEKSCICVLGVSTLPMSTILMFDVGIVPTLWYFLFFILIVKTY